jgi:hypothetical protein
MAGVTACAVLVRLPYLFNTGVDEAFYLVVGRQWLEGMPPYAYSFDVKPPLLFALMAAAETVFGPSLLAAKALAMASVTGTAFALYLFGRRFLSERAGVTAALLYILSSLSLGGAFSPAELIMAPFTIFGMLLGFSAVLARRRPPIWPLLAAGFCLGAAASVKHSDRAAAYAAHHHYGGGSLCFSWRPEEFDPSVLGGLDSRRSSRGPRGEGGACHLLSAASSAAVPHGGSVPRA